MPINALNNPASSSTALHSNPVETRANTSATFDLKLCADVWRIILHACLPQDLARFACVSKTCKELVGSDDKAAPLLEAFRRLDMPVDCFEKIMRNVTQFASGRRDLVSLHTASRMLYNTINKNPPLKGIVDTQKLYADIENDRVNFDDLTHDQRRDVDIMRRIIARSPQVLRHPSLGTTADYLLTAIQIAPHAFVYADPELKSNREFILSAMTHAWINLGHIERAFLSDREFMIAATRKRPNMAYFAEGELRNDPDYLQAVQDIFAEKQIPFQASAFIALVRTATQA